MSAAIADVQGQGPPGLHTGTHDPLRILVIPKAESSGTSERSPSLYRLMRSRHRVAALEAPWDGILYNPSRARWPRLFLYIVDKILLGLRGLVYARRFRAQVVFCETAHHAIAGLAIAKILGIRCVWDSHGNGKLFYESLGKSRLAVRLIGAFEKFLGNRVDALMTVSGVDAAAYVSMGLDPSKIHVVPVFVNLHEIDSTLQSSSSPPTAPTSGRPALIFMGSFGYSPNREALEWANDVLAPYLERRGTPCEIWIAGREIPKVPFHPYIRPLGFVPNIYACIRSASLCIVPVRRGVGMLTKVIDSMAVGTPVVLFDFAAKGIPELRAGFNAYVATTDSEFLRDVEEALSDPEGRRAMSVRARRLVEQKFDREAYAGQLDAIIRGPTGVPGG
ncbi:MAG: glycosyltransferase family 4 protein [Methanobacteriota archaeon]|nr:MAG: glycosyltransferase family 4 protein [Euryarchaeota archaeon]